MFKTKSTILPPAAWGLEINSAGELMTGGCSTVDLARHYGTPLHVVDEIQLQRTAGRFVSTLREAYPGKVSVHFAFKCNPAAGVLQLIRQAGLKAEVMSRFELELALHLGYTGADIIINGPYKPDDLLATCLEKQVRYIIIDSPEELHDLNRICQERDQPADIMLRINPNFVPSGMNQGSATGSRRGCAFGLDLQGGEVSETLGQLKRYPRLHFHGFHFHIGTGIHRPQDYRSALSRLKPLVRETQKMGFPIRTFDIGGGLAAATSREMTTREMLIYQAFEKLPVGTPIHPGLSFEAFAQAVTAGFRILFDDEDMPELLVEPGRCIASSNQLLLLAVLRIKERKGLKKWLVTDGGIGTVTMPAYYEYHEVFLCNDARRPRTEKVTIIGPVCFASDIVYRNKWMPAVRPGEVLAIMDSGAYFTSWESSFGFPRPAIAGVRNGEHRLLRRRESFAEMIGRDCREERITDN